MRDAVSVRNGHVDVITQPARIIPSSRVSQPDDASPSASVSLCLKAEYTVIGKSGDANSRAFAKTVRKPSSKKAFAPALPAWRSGFATSYPAFGKSRENGRAHVCTP